MSRPDATAPLEGESRPSKSQRKREMHELQDLGERLTQLSAERLAGIDLPDELRAAVADARRITRHEARRRQMQYIGKLMRTIDAAPIRETMAVVDGRSAAETARMHRLERLRLRLLDDESVLTELAQDHPGADLQHLGQLRRNALKEREQGKAPRSFRELFRALRDLEEQPAPAAGDTAASGGSVATSNRW